MSVVRSWNLPWWPAISVSGSWKEEELRLSENQFVIIDFLQTLLASVQYLDWTAIGKDVASWVQSSQQNWEI